MKKEYVFSKLSQIKTLLLNVDETYPDVNGNNVGTEDSNEEISLWK